MNKAVFKLLIAQFLTAFADNAILFTAFAMIAQEMQVGDWYRPALQASFLVAFVILAPWVGAYADRHIKRSVLGVGNAIKALGALLLILGIDPLAAYAVVGIGAAVYGPAKYGILPELVGHQLLLKANGYIEGSTIVAIVIGAVVGAKVADVSVFWGLILVLVSYLISLVMTFMIPVTQVKAYDKAPILPSFYRNMKSFFETSRARFSMLGASIFWGATVVLRVMMVAWAPAVLMTTTTSDIAELTVYSAIGIAIGSVIVPWFIPIENLRRARLAAYSMGFLMIILSMVSHHWMAHVTLLLIGIAGGMFVVPINAALQEIGYQTIGSGGAVAIQNFFENLAMLLATAIYSYALTQDIDPIYAMMTLGMLVIIATLFVSWHLPPVVPAVELNQDPLDP